MVTAVKVDDEAKSRLEELQAEIRLQTGERMSQQALLSKLIEDAHANRDELIDELRNDTVPLTEEEKERLRAGRFASGTVTTEEDIDEVLYG